MKRKGNYFIVLFVILGFILLCNFSCNIGQNSLANTTWQDGNGNILNFGQTSFSVSMGNRNFSGEYKLSGDTVIINPSSNSPQRGALAGNTLTIWGGVFRKIQ